MLFRNIVFSVVLTFGGLAHAYTEGWSLSAGVLQNNLFDLTNDKTGKGDTWGETYLPLGVGYATSVGADWTFAPSLSFTHLTAAANSDQKTPEKGAEKNFILLNMPFQTTLATWVSGKVGFGYSRYEVKGKGGTVTLANGNSTAVFYKPNQTHTAQTIYTTLGLMFPGETVQVDFDIIVNGALSSERRSYSAMLSFSMPFGGLYGP